MFSTSKGCINYSIYFVNAIYFLSFACHCKTLEVSFTPDSDGHAIHTEVPQMQPAQDACIELEQNQQHHLLPRILIDPVYPGDLPFMAALMYNTSYKDDDTSEILCSGTLIHNRFVLTAAHCVNRIKPFLVRLGGTNLDDLNEQAHQIDVPIWKIYIHPENSFRQRTNNIALIEFEKPVPRSSYIRPICLQVTDELPENKPLLAPYWGRLNNERSKTLLKRSMKISLDNKCEEIKAYNSSEFVCASEDGRIFCTEDTGGPLILEMDKSLKSYRQIGINAIANQCSNGIADVYTKVVSQLDFIEKIVWAEKFVEKP